MSISGVAVRIVRWKCVFLGIVERPGPRSKREISPPKRLVGALGTILLYKFRVYDVRQNLALDSWTIAETPYNDFSRIIIVTIGKCLIEGREILGSSL